MGSLKAMPVSIRNLSRETGQLHLPRMVGSRSHDGRRHIVLTFFHLRVLELLLLQSHFVHSESLNDECFGFVVPELDRESAIADHGAA